MPRWRFSTEDLAQREAALGWARLSLCKELEEGAAPFLAGAEHPKQWRAHGRCFWNGTQFQWNCASCPMEIPQHQHSCWVSLSQGSTRLE